MMQELFTIGVVSVLSIVLAWGGSHFGSEAQDLSRQREEQQWDSDWALIQQEIDAKKKADTDE